MAFFEEDEACLQGPEKDSCSRKVFHREETLSIPGPGRSWFRRSDVAALSETERGGRSAIAHCSRAAQGKTPELLGVEVLRNRPCHPRATTRQSY